VQKHAIALGYFFLSVFCVVASAHTWTNFTFALLLAALLAFVVGMGYAASPLVAGVGYVVRNLVPRFREVYAWCIRMVRLAQEPPTRTPASTDEQSA